MNALDGPVTDCEEETHQLFTLDIHSVRTVSVKKRRKYFGKIKLSATNNSFVWQTLQLDTASTTKTLAVEDLAGMCPAGFDTTQLITDHLLLFYTPMEAV